MEHLEQQRRDAADHSRCHVGMDAPRDRTRAEQPVGATQYRLFATRLVVEECGDLYRPRFVRHRTGPYAAMAAVVSCFCRAAAGVMNPCRSISHVVL